MKTKHFASVAVLLFLVGSIVLSFQSCKPDEEEVPCDTCMVAYKPNIYLYPVQTEQLKVEVIFPEGGRIIASEPTYNLGWDVEVEPNGRIDGKYDFLFYESRQPNRWQRSNGWVVSQTDVARFFDENLSSYGFSKAETADFINWWTQRLRDYPYYVVYPQTNTQIDPLIRLRIFPEPDKVLRLFYLIEGVAKRPAHLLPAPAITAFERKGFVVAEWGVLMQE